MADTQSPPPLPPPYSLVTTSLLVNSIVFFIIATAAVALRFYARSRKSWDLQWDDWTIVFSLLMCLAYSVNTWVAADIGGVNMTPLLFPQAMAVFVRCLWIEGIPLGVCLASIKISVLLFYRRIFITETFKRSVDVAVVILAGWAISTVIALCLVASPISDAWAFPPKPLNYNFSAFSMSVASISLVFDVMVLCFPLPMIKNLNLPTRRKFQLAGIFWLGGFCCIAASIRLYYLYQSNHRVFTSPTANHFVDATSGFVWAHIEPSCSIVAACLPTYGPLFKDNKMIAGLWVSIRSFMSLGSQSSSSHGFWSRESRKKSEGSTSDSGLPLDSKGNGHWQKLGKSDISVSETQNVVKISGDAGSQEHDLEAQHEGTAPLRIKIKRGFGAEY